MGNGLYAPCGWMAGPACWLDALADASLALLLPLGCCACCRGAQRLLEYVSLSSCALQGPRDTMHISVPIIDEWFDAALMSTACTVSARTCACCCCCCGGGTVVVAAFDPPAVAVAAIGADKEAAATGGPLNLNCSAAPLGFCSSQGCNRFTVNFCC